MFSELLAADDTLASLHRFKAVFMVAFLALLWLWETCLPFFHWPRGRVKHGARNLGIAVFNTAVLAVIFGALTVGVADWTTRNSVGLLHALPVSTWLTFAMAIVLLDGWMYLWHRANHVIPFLWRFHRMHHSDDKMDVTTAVRFHVGEHVGAATLRLGLIPLLGLSIWQIVVYEILVLAVTEFHHANISLGRWDRWLRLVIVTPDMHKIHHSRWRPETDSNYSTVLSAWDRLAHTFRMRSDPGALQVGLNEFDNPQWQTMWGMLKTPFVTSRRRQRRQQAGVVTQRQRHQHATNAGR